MGCLFHIIALMIFVMLQMKKTAKADASKQALFKVRTCYLVNCYLSLLR